MTVTSADGAPSFVFDWLWRAVSHSVMSRSYSARLSADFQGPR